MEVYGLVCILLFSKSVVIQNTPMLTERVVEYYACVEDTQIEIRTKTLFKVNGKPAGAPELGLIESCQIGGT